MFDEEEMKRIRARQREYLDAALSCEDGGFMFGDQWDHLPSVECSTIRIASKQSIEGRVEAKEPQPAVVKLKEVEELIGV